MAWKDWIGYPGMAQDQTIEAMVNAIVINEKAIKVITQAILDLQERVTRLEKANPLNP